MISQNLQNELLDLFNQGQFQLVLDRANREEITPGRSKDSKCCCSCLFQLDIPDCLLWCEGLAPSLNGDAGFASMHGAVLRRLGRFDDAEKVFRAALNNTPSNTFLRNNFANLLIDQQAFEEAESILKDLLKENPSYEDAKVNLNRLIFQKNLATPSPNESSSTSPTHENVEITC